MTVPSFVKTIANKVYDGFAKDTGKMFVWTGAIGWALSSIAQITAVSINDKIPKEQKKFLIPQEIADAVINIVSFIAITQTVNKFGKRLVSGGRLVSPAIKKFMVEHGLESKIGTKELIDVFDKKTGKKLAKKEMASFSISNQEVFKENKDFQKEYSKFYNGVDFISSVVGSIISCNIVTPYLRNAFATREQKRNMLHIQAPSGPVLPMYSTKTMDEYGKSSLKPIYPNTSSSMKI